MTCKLVPAGLWVAYFAGGTWLLWGFWNNVR